MVTGLGSCQWLSSGVEWRRLDASVTNAPVSDPAHGNTWIGSVGVTEVLQIFAPDASCGIGGQPGSRYMLSARINPKACVC